MEIKILWTGCANCVRLEENVKIALDKAWKQADVKKVTEIVDIMSYWVMWTPWLVIDNKVISSWKVNSIDEIVEILNWWDTINGSEKKWGCCCGSNC
jgi:hypothetical protein